MARRITKDEVKDITLKIAAKQGGVCAICGKKFTRWDIPVLDHDHDTGFIRGVLHNSCNGTEGKVKTQAHRSHKGVKAYDYLISLGEYLKKHSEPQYQILHHTHQTEAEKKAERNRKARAARAKKRKEAGK